MVTTKSAITITSLAFLLMFGGGLYMFMNLGDIAKRAIEAKASEAMGVKVTMAGFKIEIQNKKASVYKLRIANPEGFSSPYAVVVERISVSLGDLSPELVRLKDISVRGVDAYLEVTQRGTNLSALKGGMKSKTQSSNDNGDAAEAAGPKVIIDSLSIEGAKVSPQVVLFDQGAEVTPVLVPPLKLLGIGRKEQGVTVQEAVVQVIGPFVQSASKAAGNAGLYEGLSADVLKDMGMGTLNKFKEDASALGESIGSGIKSLFGN